MRLRGQFASEFFKTFTCLFDKTLGTMEGGNMVIRIFFHYGGKLWRDGISVVIEILIVLRVSIDLIK